MKKISKYSMLLMILSSMFLSSCENKEDYTFVYHTFSEQEIKSDVVDKDSVSLHQLPTPEKEGYTFEGWYLDKNYLLPYSVNGLYTDVVELYAKYTINEYTINFFVSNDKIETKKYNYSDKIDVLTPSLSDYIFDGWYMEPELVNIFDYYYMPAKDVTVYASWKPVEQKETYLVFYTGDDTYFEPMLVNEKDSSIELPTYSKVGYTFNGWYLDKEFNKVYSFNKLDFNKKVITLYANININEYDLNIYSKGEIISSQKIEYNQEISLPELFNEGYIFSGWYLDADFTSIFNYKNMPSQNLDVYAKWDNAPTYTVNVSFNIEGAFSYNGNLVQNITYENPDFEKVELTPNIGYKFSYYEYDNQKYSSNIIELNNINHDIDIVVYAEYATHELPIINIDTNNEKITSKEDYVNMTFNLSNTENSLNNVTGGIRLRGNSTSNKPKKPYRIKFDKKQSLFGLDKAKSWVLLADYLDPSGLHNYTAFSLANELDGFHFIPSPHKVNLYLNNEFIGLYTLCEQVQENEGRMDIEVDITSEMTNLKDFNFFISMDASSRNDATAVLDETYFYLEEYDKYFELKYPEKDVFVSEEQFNNFFSQLKEYVKDLMDIFTNKNVERIKEEVNIKSLVDYLIIDQIMGEQDHAYKSFHMYYTNTSLDENENKKLNFGPIWDYDWSLYTSWTGEPNLSYEVKNTIYYSNVFFKAMANVPEFYNIVKQRYTNNASKVLGNYISELYLIEASMKESINLNHQRWYQNYDPNMSKDNIDFLNRYLLNRKQLLDDLWSI